MKMTQREFFIAAAAALFGFFLCYFLFGTTQPDRPPAPKMTLIASLPTSPPTNQPSFQFRSALRTNGQFLRSMPAFVIEDRPELIGYQKSSHMLDLMSSRYKAHVDLSDLQ